MSQQNQENTGQPDAAVPQGASAAGILGPAPIRWGRGSGRRPHPRAPGAGKWPQFAAGLALLAAGLSMALAENGRWRGCSDDWWAPACITAQGNAADYLAPLPGWIGPASSAAWQGLALLLIAFALHVMLKALVPGGVRTAAVAVAGLAGLMTLIPAVTGQGLAVNMATLVLWVLVAPLLYLVIFVIASYPRPQPAKLWAMWLALLLAATSPLLQLIISAPLHHDTPPWYAMIQAVPLGAYGAAIAIAALFRRRG